MKYFARATQHAQTLRVGNKNNKIIIIIIINIIIFIRLDRSQNATTTTTGTQDSGTYIQVTSAGSQAKYI